MSFQITSPAGPSEVSVSAKSTPTISHLDIPTAGVEVTLTIAAGTKSFRILPNNKAKITVATTVGGSVSGDDNYVFYPGFEWQEELLAGTNALTFYVSSNKASTILKIITWT